jgi:hypothetical protein
MYKVWLLSLAGALVLAMIGHNPASALTADELITTIGTDPNVPVEYAQRRGYRGGRAVAYRGGRAVAYRGGRAVAYRGYGRRAVAVGGAAYYGSRYCPQYTYGCPPYYYGRQAYRGAYYRGGRVAYRGAYYRGGRAVYRGGYRGARVAQYRGGGRRR